MKRTMMKYTFGAMALAFMLSGASADARGTDIRNQYSASQYSLHAQVALVNAAMRRALAENGYSGATSLSESEANYVVPAGTIIPVRLDSSLNSERSKPGQIVTARVMQDIELTKGTKIRAGSKLIGHVTEVTHANEQNGSEVSFVFDELSSRNAKQPIHLYLRALASSLEVEDAQLPSGGSDETTPESSWTVIQVGGDVVYRGCGVVMRGPDVVGKPLWPSDDVIEFDREHRAQAVWVFSLDASGMYGFSHMVIRHSGRTDSSRVITLSSQNGNVKVRRGSGMLLATES